MWDRLTWLVDGRDSLATRCLLLVSLMALVAVVDLLRNRSQATRWREYAFILAFGGAGALVGMAVDSITSSVSRDYFIVGKGVAAGPTFMKEMLSVGACAGFCMGCLVAGVL